MKQKIFVVMLDVTGVQAYIFASNKLSENLGASYIVKNIYNFYLQKVIEEKLSLNNFDIDFWKKSSGKLFTEYDSFDIGYIGGGNALLFFKNEDDYKNVVKAFNKLLLVKAPGLSVVSACIQTTIEEIEKNFVCVRKSLNENLEINKNRYSPNINLPRYGFTASCPRTGLSAEFIKTNNDNNSEILSSVSFYKAEASKNKLDSVFEDELKGDTLPKEIDQLGQDEGDDNFIAIVHIDGNGIGDIFKKEFDNGYKKGKDFSIKLEHETEESFKDLIKHIRDNENIFLSEKNKKDNKNDETLPIRPIIIGGDDITFVCRAKFGIYFAEKFIKFFEKRTSAIMENKITACAGITIVKTKYPFYRAYKLTEELCSNAKMKRKLVDGEGSWIDFYIVENAKSGSIEDIRLKHFTAQSGKLYSKPYKLSENKEDNNSFAYLKEKSRLLKQFPKNKIMELRSVLFENNDRQKAYIEQQKFRERNFPVLYENNSLFKEAKTIYLDMIELLDFYPEEYIREGGYN